MKITRANVQKYTKEKGLELIQIDGIPEGFSFKSAGIHIGPKFYGGQYFAFIPMMPWDKGIVQENNIYDLLKEYNKPRIRDGKR